MMERRLQQAAVDQRLSRPTDLPNLEKAGQQSSQKAVLQSLLKSRLMKFYIDVKDWNLPVYKCWLDLVF